MTILFVFIFIVGSLSLYFGMRNRNLVKEIEKVRRDEMLTTDRKLT